MSIPSATIVTIAPKVPRPQVTEVSIWTDPSGPRDASSMMSRSASRLRFDRKKAHFHWLIHAATDSIAVDFAAVIKAAIVAFRLICEPFVSCQKMIDGIG